MSSPSIPKVKVDSLPNVRPASQDCTPRLWGIPLKYVSLVTLAVQNAALTIIMHYSRISTSPSQTYSAASAVLLNELLKGSISLIIAFSRIEDSNFNQVNTLSRRDQQIPSWIQPAVFFSRCKKLCGEILSPDCWKLSIPAILYVIQNNLQFVAASNLEAATFQVSYQMKILTTAAFSVVLLRKRLSSTKWTALMALAFGVGIVQIQSGSSKNSDSTAHDMHPFTGFMAVVAACFTSGLAGVYFEMVLKGSQADLWVRNVQLSLFSLIPALVPVFAGPSSSGSIFANFGGWAWATVLTQVAGGLITAIVIKYSDNILKGFATSLSIVLASLASVVLFDFQVTPSFIAGSSTVLAATWLYNQPDGADLPNLPKIVAGVVTPRRGSIPGTPITMEPVDAGEPILGEPDEKRRGSFNPGVLSAALKLVTPRSSLENFSGHNPDNLAPASPIIASHPSSSTSLADYQLRYTASSSRSHSPAPIQPVRTHSSTGSLGVPPSQLSTYSYSKSDNTFSIVNLNDSPGRLSR